MTVVCRPGALLWLLALTALTPGQAAGQGYALRSDHVEVSRRAHWEAWQYPHDVVTVSGAGAVSPRYIEPTVNATQQAAQYTYKIPSRIRDQYANAYMEDRDVMVQGGIKRAGSRPQSAPHAIDGREDTYWEPDRSDPVDNWWLEVDLGRVVSASQVVVRFAADTPESSADPFLQFRVHTATGLSPFGQQDQSGAMDYVLAGSTTQPNTDQRTFEFQLDPVGKHSEGLEGRLVQYVRIAATDSRLDRAETVTQEEYEALDSADRGAVDHIWAIAGEERLVTAERYAALPESERGGIRYYRRERPRLAELEVWTVGDNVALGLLERGGSLRDINPNSFPERAFDGSMRTDWFELVYRTIGETAEWGLLTVDLGAQFWVNAVRILSRPPKTGGGEFLLFGYLLRGSDGTRAPDGSLIWTDLSAEKRQLNDDKRMFEDRFDMRRLRYLELRNLDISRRTKAYLGDRVQSVVTEMQIYAAGYPPAVDLTSDIIELGEAKNLTSIEWDAQTPPGTEVDIRTRTGDELQEIHYYYKSDGNQVSTREEYEALPSFFRGPIVTEILPGQGWSSWSSPYEFSGQSLRSPSPRRYMMLNAALRSSDPEAAASVQAVRVRFTMPLAAKVTGEIEPKRDVPASQLKDFHIYVRPEYASNNLGLDIVRVVSPSSTPLTLTAAAVGDASAFVAANADAFLLQADGTFANGNGDTLTLVPAAPDTLHVQLPHVLGPGGPELLRLSLRTRVFRSGSTFTVEVGNTRRPGVWQRVDSGDVVGDTLGAGEGLTVMTRLASSQIQSVRLVPQVFTPNGDGVNDVLTCRFAVLRISGSKEVAVELYDLGGRMVRRLREQRDSASGMYQMDWDGRDAKGRLVPPGLYVVRIHVDSDGGGEGAARGVAGVAY